MTVMLIAAFVVGLYMAWNIGANDVANSFGTSVGSGSLNMRQAILIAAVFEFTGAFFVGGPVAKTISGDIVDVVAFARLVPRPEALGIGMLAALLAASVWLNVATVMGQPVSTTHAIIGGVVGFAAVAAGPGCIRWSSLGTIAASWVVSPVVGAVLAYLVYWAIRKLVLDSRHPVFMASRTLPLAIGGLTAIVLFSVVYRGLPGLHLDLPLVAACPLSLAAGAAALAGSGVWARRQRRRHVRRAQRYELVERWFGYMQIATACYMSFAHGANDVANAVGPLAWTIRLFSGHNRPADAVVVPAWLLALGGVGIVLGLATYGRKVIEAVGTKITEITPTRGFAAQFGTATAVLVFSKLGMPISTTFVIVGAVMGVGFARGFAAIDLRVIRKIVASWFVTIPASAVLAAVFYWTLMTICLP